MQFQSLCDCFFSIRCFYAYRKESSSRLNRSQTARRTYVLSSTIKMVFAMRSALRGTVYDSLWMQSPISGCVQTLVRCTHPQPCLQPLISITSMLVIVSMNRLVDGRVEIRVAKP